MKWILAGLGVVAIVCGICFFGGNKPQENEEYMRIHIVANSNSTVDQNVKYVVKDAVVEFLIPCLAEAENKAEAEKIISSNLTKINEVVNVVLQKQGVKYKGSVSLTSEDMPMRAYGDLILQEGVYDSLKITLGQGHGDNWWCVVFPAVCFINSQNPQNVEYISKIWEIISSVI